MRLGNPNLAVDASLEEEGKWFDFPSIWWTNPDKPMRGKIRSQGTRRYQAFVRAKTRGLTTREQLEERAFEISADGAAELLADIDNWIDADGNHVGYQPETIRAILSDYDNRDVVDFIIRCSDVDNFRIKRSEELEKN